MAPIEFDRKKQKTKDLERRLTPIEIARLLQDGDHEKLPFFLRPIFAAGEPPVGYEREIWSEGVTYYTAHRGAKGLIIIFCEPGVPTGYFLQMLRDDLYDVVVLYDRRKLFFDRGIAGFSTSLIETLRPLETFIKTKCFHEVITFGVSMGAYPA